MGTAALIVPTTPQAHEMSDDDKFGWRVGGEGKTVDRGDRFDSQRGSRNRGPLRLGGLPPRKISVIGDAHVIFSTK